MPLEILAAPFGTEVLVLELAMRGPGQIAELAAICEPDVGVITNIGPVHLEQLGSLEGVAAAKAELLDGMAAGCTGVVPSDEPLLEPWLRDDLEIVTFGPGGDVYFEGSSLKGGVIPDAPPTHHVVIARRRADRARPAVRPGAQHAQRARRGRRRAGDRGDAERRRSTSTSPRCGASAWRSGSGPSSSTTATTPTRSPCAPPLTISPRSTPRAAAWRSWATCSNSAPPSASTTARSAPTRPRPGSTCS